MWVHMCVYGRTTPVSVLTILACDRVLLLDAALWDKLANCWASGYPPISGALELDFKDRVSHLPIYLEHIDLEVKKWAGNTIGKTENADPEGLLASFFFFSGG